jgi:hypothetical protein
MATEMAIKVAKIVRAKDIRDYPVIRILGQSYSGGIDVIV